MTNTIIKKGIDMGYESRIYIVRKGRIYDETYGKRWAEKIAMFDMCKYPRLADLMRSKPATDCYIYEGDTIIIEDCYGEPLYEASCSDVIALLEKDVENGEDYRRIFPLLAMLKTFEEHKEQWGEIAVLHFGH